MRNLRGGLTAFAAGLLLLGFTTPVRLLWARAGLGWWMPFLIWALAILALLGAAFAPQDTGRDAV